MADEFETRSTGLESPATKGFAITPDDNTDLANSTRFLWVGSAGDLAVHLVSGDVVTFVNVQVGWQPLRIRRVLATGTTAGSMVGCY